jgi:DNA-binding response OmpR family regulator
VIAERLIEYCDAHELPIPGHYTALGIDVSADLEGATYLWQPLPFTKTECMILRFLIRAYPTPVNAERILKYAYRPSRRPDAANIRTHVSIMNKKFRELTGRSLIEAEFGEGYRIVAPVGVGAV